MELMKQDENSIYGKQSPLILASASPRRKELLRLITEDFLVEESRVDEKVWERNILHKSGSSFEERTWELVVRLAETKAKFVQEQHPGALVIGADTVVVHDNVLLGKPESKEEAFRMIRSLAGETHKVLTGVAVLFEEREECFVSETKVRFYPWSSEMEKEVYAYIEEGHPFDKAGGYGIQEKAGLWVEAIEGDYFNVVGLPVARLNQVLKRFLIEE